MHPGQDEAGRPIGFALPGWTPPPKPARTAMEGKYCRLEPLDAAVHAEPLFDADAREVGVASWTYLAYGPFNTKESYRLWMTDVCAKDDPLFFAIVIKPANIPVGVASYLRISPADGSIEVGHLHYSPHLQKTTAATEAMYLMIDKAFALGYRRYEWKCDALNERSRRAATRLGFTFDGIFRQATVYKKRNRDTAWYSIIDTEWPALQQAYRSWLAPDNFDAEGRQRSRLQELIRERVQ